MIPAGRTVIDTYGIAVLYSMSPQEVAFRRPWEKAYFPAPLTSPRSSVTRSPLWDEEQVTAFVNGEPVPALPSQESCEDLLDVADVAERLRISIAAWAAFEHYEYQHDRPTRRTPIVPVPDRVIYGHRHWFRRSVDAYVSSSAPNRTEWNDGARDPHQRVDLNLVGELLDRLGEEGEDVSWAEIARKIDRLYFDATKRASAHTDRESAMRAASPTVSTETD